MAEENLSNAPLLDDIYGSIVDSIHISDLIFILIVIILTIFVSKIVDKLLKNQFKIISQKLNVDETIYRIFRHVTVAFVYLFGIIVIVAKIPTLQNISIALFAGAGFAGIVVGLAAQTTLANIISGLSLALFRPFRVGDRVNIQGEYGTISDITLRHTVIKTWDNRRLILPNHIISDEVIINWSIEDPTVSWPVDIGISYDSNIDHARKIMIEEAKKHYNVMTYSQIRRYDPSIQEGEEVTVRLTELGDFAVNLRLLFWVEDRSVAYTTGCDIREAIKKRFDAEGIEIPFPYRTIVYKNYPEKEEKRFDEKAD
ncbi:mechanosensitive ion channel family protein [Methanohalophilus sp.]|uniref:mechanosensitive ion channel family protein n=1 Tax=Methanohalophilus sp. TaxID=1966352 RepID=UPI002611E955|nr:mechanosensitive ion channel family protein [Methanohalophilus sp.]MDK2892120.1 small conductance mechanosensitive channel [Methanohalophilus sp.]